MNQPYHNELWESLDTRKEAHRVKVPAIHQGGWYDTFIKGTLEGFVSRQNEGERGQRGHKSW